MSDGLSERVTSLEARVRHLEASELVNEEVGRGRSADEGQSADEQSAGSAAPADRQSADEGQSAGWQSAGWQSADAGQSAGWRPQVWAVVLVWARSRWVIATACILLLMGVGALLGWDAGDVARMLEPVDPRGLM